jgi:hypothetical protein
MSNDEYVRINYMKNAQTFKHSNIPTVINAFEIILRP